MKKIFMRTIAIVLTFCFTFTFSVSAGFLEIIGDIVSANNIDSLVEYDYVNKTYRTISASSIPDYASMTTTTYELSAMFEVFSEVPSLAELENSNASPLTIVDPDEPFRETPPVEDGIVQEPYSGVVNLIIGHDSDNDGYASDEDEDCWISATGFMVAPDVMVTAAHNIIDLSEPVVEMRVYSLTDSSISPKNLNEDFIYPERWVYSSAYVDNISSNHNITAMDYDWCVVKLQEPIYGVHYFECSWDLSEIQYSTIAISGYPWCDSMTCAMGCGHKQYHQLTSEGSIQNNASYTGSARVFYNNNARSGHSGSPVYDKITHKCYAIHAYGAQTPGGWNSGTIITQTIYNIISNYITS